MSNDANAATDASPEDYLLRLWSSQLNRSNLTVRDDFFEAGGSSMQVIEMLMTVAEHYGKEVDIAAFFNEPSIQRLSGLLQA